MNQGDASVRKSNKILVTVIIVMAVALGALLVMNWRVAGADRAADGMTVSDARSGKIIKLPYEKIASSDALSFSAVLRSSDKAPEEHEYAGIELQTLLKHNGIDVTTVKQVVIKGSDGYCTALAKQEILQDENIYIVFGQDGAALADRGHGGNGPLMLVIRDDPFSERWCKYVAEVEVK